MTDYIRDTYFPQITQTHKEFENNLNIDELKYLLSEIPLCAITAARFELMVRYHEKRATSVNTTHTYLFIEVKEERKHL